MRTALLCAIALSIAAAPADAAPVRVRGGARIEARARHPEPGLLELRGRLTDDDGTVIADEPVSVDIEGAPSLGVPEACRAPRLPVGRARTSRSTVVRSSPKGELCVRWPNAPDQGRLELRFSGNDYHSSAERAVVFDRTRPDRWATTIRFEPRPTVIDVDRDMTIVGALVALGEPEGSHGDGVAPPSLAGLPIVLDDAASEVLGRADTAGDGKVRFAIEGRRLGAPGSGRLRVDFAGTTTLEPASDELAVTLRSTVSVQLDGTVPPWRPDEPLGLDLLVSARRGTVDSGVVEARVEGMSRAAVPVRGGRARIVLTIDQMSAEPPTLALRYVPSSPSWAAGRELEIQLEPAPSWRWAPWLWGIVVAVAALWTGLSWRRARRSADVPRPPEREKPGIRVIGRPVRRLVWSGVVVDAHDGSAVPAARLSVQAAGGLPGDSTPRLLECTADEAGRFQFDFGGKPVGRDLTLRASARRHSVEQSALPPPGELRVVLTTRRRALLRRLVEWARARGAPFAREPEPTPGDVARAASAEPKVADWAVAVERAAFDATEVDEATERRVRDLEPTFPAPAPVARDSVTGTAGREPAVPASPPEAPPSTRPRLTDPPGEPGGSRSFARQLREPSDQDR